MPRVNFLSSYVFLIFFVCSRVLSSWDSVVVSFWSSWGSSVFSILVCMFCIFVCSVVSSLSYVVLVVGFGGSWPSLTIMTCFSSLAHQSVPSCSLKSGLPQAGHASSVSVAPCLSRSAMRLMGVSFSFLCCIRTPK